MIRVASLTVWQTHQNRRESVYIVRSAFSFCSRLPTSKGSFGITMRGGNHESFRQLKHHKQTGIQRALVQL